MRLSLLLVAGIVWAGAAGVFAAEEDGGDERGGDARGGYFDETQATTLFAFDEVSLPFSQNLKLVMRAPERHPANPVVKRGGAGDPDTWAVQFYGSVIRVGDVYRMWYVAAGEDRRDRSVPRSSPWRVAYAESRDGVHWTKPGLGL
ncbi:MAG TPA: hypothetical protein DDZ90_21895, partial [Planctomycetaceae bacterium]|nr:hypothetical protein [Planctomycetaceae bacterium]